MFSNSAELENFPNTFPGFSLCFKLQLLLSQPSWKGALPCSFYKGYNQNPSKCLKYSLTINDLLKFGRLIAWCIYIETINTTIITAGFVRLVWSLKSFSKLFYPQSLPNLQIEYHCTDLLENLLRSMYSAFYEPNS